MIMLILFKFFVVVVAREQCTGLIKNKQINNQIEMCVTHQLFLDTKRTVDSVVNQSYCYQHEFLNPEVVDCHSIHVLWFEQHERFALQVNRHATMVMPLFVFPYIFVRLDFHCPVYHHWPSWPDQHALMTIDLPAFCMPHSHLKWKIMEFNQYNFFVFEFFCLISFNYAKKNNKFYTFSKIMNNNLFFCNEIKLKLHNFIVENNAFLWAIPLLQQSFC